MISVGTREKNDNKYTFKYKVYILREKIQQVFNVFGFRLQINVTKTYVSKECLTHNKTTTEYSNEIHDIIYSVPKKKKKSVHFLMLNISKISRRFFCKFGMVSPKYTIHRSNIKPILCWAEIFVLYGNI